MTLIEESRHCKVLLLSQKDHRGFLVENYHLKNSAILDSGTTIHIFNEISPFTSFRTADPGDFVWAGTEKVPTQGYGAIDIMVTVPGTDNTKNGPQRTF